VVALAVVSLVVFYSYAFFVGFTIQDADLLAMRRITPDSDGDFGRLKHPVFSSPLFLSLPLVAFVVGCFYAHHILRGTDS
jgi:hypothetical protein